MTWLINWLCCGFFGLILALIVSKLPNQPTTKHIANILAAISVLLLSVFFSPVFIAYVVYSLYRTCVYGETFDLFDQKNIVEMQEPTETLH